MGYAEGSVQFQHLEQLYFLNYEQWHELFFENNNHKGFFPASKVTYLGKSHSIVTYRHPLGNVPGQTLGSIVVLIDNNQILKLLGGLDIKDGGRTAASLRERF